MCVCVRVRVRVRVRVCVHVCPCVRVATLGRWIVEDAPTFGPVRPNTDLTKPLGVVNANYQIVIDLTSGSLDEWYGGNYRRKEY